MVGTATSGNPVSSTSAFPRPIADIFRFPTPKDCGIKDARLREFIKKATATGNGPCHVVIPGAAVIEHRWVAQAARAALPKVTQPVLILHPRDDNFAALNNATYLQENLQVAVDLVVLDDCYHMVTVDRQRNVVLERTASFAARIFGTI